jgi:hypothetical protein
MKQVVSRLVWNTVALIMLLAACQSAALAEKHPHYMHAMSDLRAAKAMLEHPDEGNVMKDANNAANEINACLQDLQSAAWYDRKDPHHNPAPEFAGMDRLGRLHKALELMRRAHDDMAKEEDEPAAVGFQARALKHVDRAIGFTRRAIGDKVDDSILRI